MRVEIREELVRLAENDYKEFSSKLIPQSKKLLGVRLPQLRMMAKQIAKGDWRSEIDNYDGDYEDIYFEEVMLRAMIIGYGTSKEGNLEDALNYVKKFIPHVDNWSVCDSFCVSFTLPQHNKAEVWEFLHKYLYSNVEFEVRVGLITILDQYLKYDKNGSKLSRKRIITMEDIRTDTTIDNAEQYPYLTRILDVLNREYLQGYYAQMAAAWTMAEAFVTFPYETMQILENNCKLDNWTYNKTLQKICESKNPGDEVKALIRKMKRQ